MKNPEYNSSFHSDLYKKLKAGEISKKEWADNYYCTILFVNPSVSISLL
jgi:hypothetical protein